MEKNTFFVFKNIIDTIWGKTMRQKREEESEIQSKKFLVLWNPDIAAPRAVSKSIR